MVETKLTLIFLIAGLSISTSLDLNIYRQPDDVLYGGYDDLKSAEDSNLCTRYCDGKPKICYYEFYVENYATMGPACESCPNSTAACMNPQCVTADGVERHILTYNRRLPGPSIQVCVDDTIVVDVHNELGDGATTIHWHGIPQKGTQFYDGVPQVTQCPINPGNTFRYTFKASDPGSYFYHSHLGLQKVDGLSGPLLIRQNKAKESYGNLYDFDLPSHVLFVMDWMHIGADEKFPGFIRHDAAQNAVSYLFNGRGVYVPTNATLDSKMTNLPLTEFTVQKGKRYRFRIIGSTCLSCTVSIKFYGHRVTLINADSGGPITPTDIDTIVLNSGDRYDVILTANQSVDSYWIQARGTGECINAQQFGILRYSGHSGKPSTAFPSGVQSIQTGKILNSGTSFCNTTNDICLSKLKSPIRNQETNSLQERKKENFFIEFNFYSYSVPELFQNNTYDSFWIPLAASPTLYYLYTSTLNNISYAAPPSPLLSQYNDIPKSAFCPKECYQQIETRKPCSCLNIIKVNLHSEVTMIIVDYGQSSAGEFIPDGLVHPFHLHGYNFYILEEGRFEGGLEGLREGSRTLKRRLKENDFKTNCSIQKDTVSVPTSGYVVIRFIADNPGFWLFHCHFAYHLDAGMGGVIQVGELSDMPPVPKGFPKCSDYQPPVHGPL